MGFIVATIPAVFAAIVLLGWGFHDETLQRLGLATVAMNPTSAVCFLSLSGALWLQRSSRSTLQSASQVLLALVAALGAYKILSLIAKTPFEIDTIIFADRLTTAGSRPSRIAPNAAICFLLIGIALTIAQSKIRIRALYAQVLALAVALIALFALVGYLYDVTFFYTLPAFFPMAIQTAMAFLSLSAWVFIQTRAYGLVEPFTDTGPAGRTLRLLLPAAIVGPVGIGWLRLLGQRAGLYNVDIGVALMVMANVLTLGALILLNAKQVWSADSARRKAEAELVYLASHDFLTGLANRAYFMARLQARLTRLHRRADDAFALMCMDLDGFKQINDRLGHPVGDEVLRDVAKRLLNCVRPTDLVSRLGGDEFTILLDRISTAEEATVVAVRILDNVGSIVESNEEAVLIGISIGIVVTDISEQKAETLLRDADRALYDAKHAGGSTFVIYSSRASHSHEAVSQREVHS
jgi:diguanylate cyclase (GGDEF)-like protein